MAYTPAQIQDAMRKAGINAAPSSQDIKNANTYGLGIFAANVKKMAATAPATPATAPAVVNPVAPTPAIAAPAPAAPAPVIAPPSPVQAPVAGKATLYGPAGEREQVDASSSRSTLLQRRGWTFDVGQSQTKSKATYYGPNGERRVVFTGTYEEEELKNRGYTPREGGPRTTSDQVRGDQNRSALDQLLTDQDKQRELNRLKIDAELDALKKQVTGTAAPAAPNFTEQFNTLRTQQGLPGLETEVQTLDKQLADLDASFRQGNEQARNQLAPLSVIGGQQRELDVQYQEKRDAVLRERTAKVNQLNTATSMISTQMDLMQTDYNNAVQTYEKSYQRNLDAIRLFQAEREYTDDIERQEQQDAQANLATLTNMMQESGKGWDQLDPAMQATIQRLEMQSGLPRGSFTLFTNTLPKAKLLATKDGTDAAGNDVTTFIYEDENGMPGLAQTIKTGGVTKTKSSGGGGGGGGNPSASGKGYKVKRNYNTSTKKYTGYTFLDNRGQAIPAFEYAEAIGKTLDEVLDGSGDAGDQEIVDAIREAMVAGDSYDEIIKDIRESGILLDDGSVRKVDHLF